MLIATPNLCLDRTEFLSALVPGSVVRSSSVEVTAGGKGVNVARVLRAYANHPTIIGFAADDDRDRLLGLLAAEGAAIVPVAIPGPIRQAIIMIEQAADRITVLNEPGSVLTSQAWSDYLDAVRSRIDAAQALVCSGSLPPGVPVDGYGQLVGLARSAGAFTLVDTAPAALRAALASRPDLVTPNLEEAEAAVAGHGGDVLTMATTDVRARSEKAALALCKLGAVRAAVTAGADGVAFADEHGVLSWIPTVPVDVVSAVGAGDSFVAGLVLSLFGDVDHPSDPVERWQTALVRGTATASASCEQLRAGGVDPARDDDLMVAIRQGLAA